MSVVGRQGGGPDLVKERLEPVVVAAVDDRRVGQRRRTDRQPKTAPMMTMYGPTAGKSVTCLNLGAVRAQRLRRQIETPGSLLDSAIDEFPPRPLNQPFRAYRVQPLGRKVADESRHALS